MLEKASPVRVFFAVFVILLVLVALTVEAARHDLGRLNFFVAVLIAAIKAFLIALYFMHVRHSPELTRLVIAAGLLWLAILFSLSLADYWTRDWLPTIERPQGHARMHFIPNANKAFSNTTPQNVEETLRGAAV
jgi:cytochrome c oxidase subunit 4